MNDALGDRIFTTMRAIEDERRKPVSIVVLPGMPNIIRMVSAIHAKVKADQVGHRFW